MEKSKKRLIANCVYWAVLLIVCASMFFVSVSAGICSILFYAAGFLFGYFKRTFKLQEKFFKAFEENLSSALEGKTLVVDVDADDNVSVKVEEPKKAKKEKAQEVQED